jgi:hypothetical protein
LLVLSGEADVILPQLPPGQDRQRLTAGECVYYPAQFPHTIESAGSAPANYLMLKWVGDPTGNASPLPFLRHTFKPADYAPRERGFQTRPLFEGPTRWLHKLHCHTSTMAPGAGYEPHVDSYDVAIIILDGELESVGQTLTPLGVFFYAAGEPHGARNPGAGVARYVVFEFHAAGAHREQGRQESYALSPTIEVQMLWSGSEMIVANVETGEAFRLNPSAADIVLQIGDHADLGAVVAALLEKYSVERATLEREVRAIVAELVLKGVVIPSG